MLSSSVVTNTPIVHHPIDTKKLSKTVIFSTSGLGGTIGWIMIHPANTVTVRSSLAGAQGKKFSFMGMVRESGWLSLYDGLVAGCLRQVFYASARFGLFETFRDRLHDYRGKTDFASRVGVGAVTGGIAALLSCPMEVSTVRMSNDITLPPEKRRNYKNIVDAVTRITKEEGITAFWRGSQPFVKRAMLVGVFQIATLDQFKVMFADWLGQVKNSIPNVFCAAMTSGFIYSVATMPLETSKNRMASQERDPITKKLPYRGTLQTIAKVSKSEGFLALFNGFLPYYVRCGGHTVGMFIMVQLLRDLYTEHYLM